MIEKSPLEELLERLNFSHMPTHSIPLTKKLWRDGFNAGKEDIRKQIEGILSSLSSVDDTKQ